MAASPFPGATATFSPPPVTPTPSPTSPPPATTPVTRPVTLRAVKMVSNREGWALSPAAGLERVLKTSDGGSTWLDVTPPEPPATATESQKIAVAYFPDPQNAWVTYQFEQVFNIPEAPVVWRTADGGLNWQPSPALELPQPEFYDLSDFQGAAAGTGWFISHIGAGMNHDYIAMYRTQDGGQSWDLIADPFSTPDIQGCQKTGLDFTGSTQGWLSVDCQGVVPGAFLWQTGDGGLNWTRSELSPPDAAPDLFERAFCGLYDPLLFSELEGVIALRCLDMEDFDRQESYLLATTDGGQTWRALAYPGGEIQFLNNQVGWALSQEIHQTTDGGLTWTLLSEVPWDGQFGFVDPQMGWAVARTGEQLTLVKTDNGGGSWEILSPLLIEDQR